MHSCTLWIVHKLELGEPVVAIGGSTARAAFVHRQCMVCFLCFKPVHTFVHWWVHISGYSSNNMHAHSAFFCVDMCVFAFCVCIRVHLCLDMCSVQAGDCVLCTIWSSGSTRLFCNDECVCYLLFFTVCTVCALYFDLCTIWSSSGSGARAASACRIGNSCKKEASATLSLVQIVLNSFT